MDTQSVIVTAKLTSVKCGNATKAGNPSYYLNMLHNGISVQQYSSIFPDGVRAEFNEPIDGLYEPKNDGVVPVELTYAVGDGFGRYGGREIALQLKSMKAL